MISLFYDLFAARYLANINHDGEYVVNKYLFIKIYVNMDIKIVNSKSAYIHFYG